MLSLYSVGVCLRRYYEYYKYYINKLWNLCQFIFSIGKKGIGVLCLIRFI